MFVFNEEGDELKTAFCSLVLIEYNHNFVILLILEILSHPEAF